jgi:hypothetical protein
VPGSFVVLSRVHGSVESPAFFGGLVCAAAKRAGEGGVLAAVAMPPANPPALDALLANPPAAAARTTLLAAPHFTTRGGTPATARRWSPCSPTFAAGARLACQSPFSPLTSTIPPSTAHHEKRPWPNASLRRSSDSRKPPVPTGNLHSRVVRGVPWDSELEPMAFRLLARFTRLRSLDMASSGGTAWVCLMSEGGAPACGPHPLGGKDRGEPSSAVERAGANAHRGIYYLPSISPPAGATPS